MKIEQQLEDKDLCIRNCQWFKEAKKENYQEYKRLRHERNILYKKYLRGERQ